MTRELANYDYFFISSRTPPLSIQMKKSYLPTEMCLDVPNIKYIRMG